jgi:predicted transcriptional regulator
MPVGPGVDEVRSARLDRYLGSLERQLLEVLWEQGPATINQLRDRLAARDHDLVYNTVMATAARLAGKGFVDRGRDDGDRAYTYRADGGPETFLRQRFTEEIVAGLDQLGDGGLQALADALTGDQLAALMERTSS